MILFSSYAGTRKDDTPQASIDIDANRLILLDRLTDGQFENGDSDDTPENETIPF